MANAAGDDMRMRFVDRDDAGRRLAARLSHERDARPVVLGLPRGGMPVAFEVAKALQAPLGFWIAKKVGAPSNPEFAIAAVSGEVVLRDDRAIGLVGVDGPSLQDLVQQTRDRIAKLDEFYRSESDPQRIEGRRVLLIDDGIATGLTCRAAIRSIRQAGAASVVLAVPVAPAETVEAMRGESDEVVVLKQPHWFSAVGEFYDDFSAVPDDVVLELLRTSRSPGPESPAWTGSELAA